MAAETPGVQDFSDDLVDEVAGEVVGGTTRDQMLGAFSGISSRLVKLHTAKSVRLHTRAARETAAEGPRTVLHFRKVREWNTRTRTQQA